MRRIKYQLPNRRKRGKRSAFLYYFLSLLLLVLAFWYWWITTPDKQPQTRRATERADLPLPAPANIVARPIESSNTRPATIKRPPVTAAPTNRAADQVVVPVRSNRVGPVIVLTNSSETLSNPPLREYPRAVRDMFEAQLALARQGLSPGSLDGVAGGQTRAALRAFQRRESLPETGELDERTQSHLLLAEPVLATYEVTTNDLARLQPLSSTWLGKSQQTALDYETVLELLAERGQAHPNLIRRLNPSLDWNHIVPGTAVRLPAVASVGPDRKAAFARVSLGARMLEAFDSSSNLLVHFPCSIGQRMEKRPVGELHVAVIAPNPNYTFDPDIFPESAEAHQIKTKLVLAPGPNNPVGVVWIGLDKPGYGIHGTPNPEQVGRTESHGCFRLANWNAERLLKLVWVGMPVFVEW